MNRPDSGIALIYVLLVAGCSRSKDVVTTAHAASETIAVSTAQAAVRTVPAAFEVTGTFNADETSDIAPPVGGRVITTPVNVGDFVKQGAVICELDHRDAQLKLEQARAQLNEATSALRQTQSRIGWTAAAKFDPALVPEVAAARAAYESAQAQAKMAAADARRYESLVGSGDVSRGAYERARTQQETAEAQANAARQQYEATLNSARQNYQGVINAEASLSGFKAQTAMAQKAVEDSLIHAPFDGYVSARPIAAGQYVALTSKIATLLRITPLRLELQVPESDAVQMHVSAEVEASVPGYPGRKFQGKVTAVNPAVDPNSRTFTVVAEFANKDIALKPGMFAVARILLPASRQGLFVPRQAVLTDPTTSSSQLFFLRDGKARVAVVQLGPADGDAVQVLSGISAGMTIATDHLSDLYDGESVTIAGRGK